MPVKQSNQLRTVGGGRLTSGTTSDEVGVDSMPATSPRSRPTTLAVIALVAAALALAAPPARSAELGRSAPPTGRIVFSTERAGTVDLYTMSADGRRLVRLTSNSQV